MHNTERAWTLVYSQNSNFWAVYLMLYCVSSPPPDPRPRATPATPGTRPQVSTHTQCQRNRVVSRVTAHSPLSLSRTRRMHAAH